jgi:Yip1 domain
MGQGDFSSDFGGSPQPGSAFGSDDVGPGKGTRGINLMVDNPFLTIWTRPRATIRGIVDTDPYHFMVSLTVLGGISNALDRARNQHAGDSLSLSGVLMSCMVGGVLGGLFALYVGGGILKWVCSWLGGRASFKEVRAAMAWSHVPVVAALAITVLQLLLFDNELFTTKTPHLDASPALRQLFMALNGVEFVLAIWSLVLFVKCLGEVNGFSAWRALGSLFLAFLIIAIPLVLIAIAVVLALR